MSSETKPKYFSKARIANIMAAMIIVWNFALWTVLLFNIMDGGLTVIADDGGNVLLAVNPSTAILGTVLGFGNVGLGVALKHLMDSSAGID